MAWSISMTTEGWSNVLANLETMVRSEDGREELAQAVANDAYQRAEWLHHQSSYELILPDVLPSNLAVRIAHTKHPMHGYYRIKLRRGIAYTTEMLQAVEARVKAEALTWVPDALMQQVFEQIERHNTSTIGGQYVYADKDGFTLIPVELVQPEEEHAGNWYC